MDIVKLFHMGFYVPGGHALCIHGEDLFLHVLCHGILILPDKLWLIVAVAVTGDRHLHVPVTGMHGLFGVTVPAVIRILAFIVIL